MERHVFTNIDLILTDVVDGLLQTSFSLFFPTSPSTGTYINKVQSLVLPVLNRANCLLLQLVRRDLEP